MARRTAWRMAARRTVSRLVSKYVVGGLVPGVAAHHPQASTGLEAERAQFDGTRLVVRRTLTFWSGRSAPSRSRLGKGESSPLPHP